MKNVYLLLIFLGSFVSVKASDFSVNDSFPEKSMLAPMAGVYTVNPSQPASATNFTNITNAINALNTNGVSGAVTISIYNGTHVGSTLQNVTGASATNTITFTSYSNDSLQVKINSLEINNTSFVIIKKLWIDNLKFSGTTSDVTVQGNSLKKIIWNAGDNFLLEGNYIVGGVRAFRNNPGTGLINGIIIRNNTIKNGMADENQFNLLVIWSFVNRPVFENNRVEDMNLVQTGYSLIGCCTYVPYEYGGFLDFRDCGDTAFVRNNQIVRSSTKRFLVNSATPPQGPKLSHLMVYNNFISTGGEFGTSGKSVSFFYNNFLSTGATGGFSVSDDFTNFKNNNIIASGGATALAFGINASLGNSDYNNFYSTGTKLMVRSNQYNTTTDYVDLAAYQTASGKDAHSLSINPKYVSNEDLHVQHPKLVAAGTPFPTANPILKDIDNENRNQLNPCIGADEFSAISADVILQEYIGPKNNFDAAAPQTISVKIKNNGAATLSTVKIRWSVNGVDQLTKVWNGQLFYDSTVQIMVSSYNFKMLEFNNLKIWTESPNGVADMIPENDTLKIDSIIPYTKGSFTLGGNNPDLNSFTQAASILSKSGVNGPVVISIRNGKYNENPSFKFVRGASEQNTITIKGENQDATLDTLSFSSATLPTLRLDSAAFYIFKDITFRTEGSYSREVEFDNHSRFITFDRCIFKSEYSKPSYPHVEVKNPYSYGIASIDSNVVFTNNKFIGGNVGLNLVLKNGIIRGNSFIDSYSSSSSLLSINIKGSFTDKNTIIIDSNFIQNNLICTYKYGNSCYAWGRDNVGGIDVSIAGPNNDITISRNIIFNYGRTGINIYSSGTASTPIKVYNNMVTGTSTPLALNGNYIEAFYNSLNDSSYNNILRTSGSFISFKYNVVAEQIIANKSPFQFSNNNNNDISSNAFYHGDTSISAVGFMKLLSSPFISNADLHIDKNRAGAIDLYEKGLPVSYIPNDIDGQMRSTSKPSLGADEFQINANDAGVISINNFDKKLAPGIKDIEVNLRNFGKNNLTSATIHWKINDVAQPDFSWSGNLATGEIASGIKIGTYNFQGAQPFKIEVWSSAPGDNNALNDSVFIARVMPSLCGVYTLGGTNPDFATFYDLGYYLSNAGIGCGVVINVRDGEYIETLSISDLVGGSSTNTLTIKSESGDSSKVVLYQFAHASSAQQVVSITNSAYIKFEKLTFQRKHFPPNTSYYFDLVKINETNNISFNNCQFITVGAGTEINMTGNGSDLSVSNSLFIGGKSGVFVNGSYSKNTNNVNITNNKFQTPIGTNSQSYTIELLNAGIINIDGNYIDSSIAGNYLGGIKVSNITSKVSILNNKLIKLKGGHGINLEQSSGLGVSDSSFIVANNFITIDSTTNISGIYAYFVGQNIKIAYNNILNNNSNTSSSALYINTNSGSKVFKDTVVNNNLIKNKAGYAMTVQFSGTDIHLMNNNLYTTGNAKIAKYNNTDYTSISALPKVSGTNANTVSVNPLFLNDYNLHISETSLKNAGIPLSYITKDIDGDMRGTTTTTIGADEMVVRNEDIGIVGIANPVAPFAVGSQSINATIKNFGSATITSATINWSINGQMQSPYQYSGQILAGQTINVTIGNYNFLMDSSYSVKLWSSNPNGVSDGEPMNDTLLIKNLAPALSGVYTVGATGADFKTLTRSSLALQQGGMLGDVTFKIKDGIYQEYFLIDSIPYQNNYSVIWESESGDSSKVVLKYFIDQNLSKPGVLQFNNSKNITVRKITIQGKILSGGSTNLKSVVYFSTKNQNIRLESNNIIDSSYNAQASSNTIGLVLITNKDVGTSYIDNRSADSLISFVNNTFTQVNLTTNAIIDLSGAKHYDYANNVTVDYFYKKLTISGNQFNTKLYSKPAIAVYFADSVLISKNKIGGSVTVMGDKLLVVDKNDIYHEGYNQIALNVNAGKNRAIGKPVVISNNMIQTKLVGTYNGANVNNTVLNADGDRINIFHNTLVASDTGSVSGYTPGAVLIITGKYDTIKNNLLYNVAGGTLVQIPNNTPMVSDYNNYVYTNHFATGADNLNQYRTKFGQDANSVENINPYFKGSKDLHGSNILIKVAPKLNVNYDFVNKDFDGTDRGSTVCIGADEFLQPENDIVFLDASPSKIFPVGVNEFKVRVYNNGSKPITSLTVKGLITSNRTSSPNIVSNLTYNFTGNIAPMTEQTITIGQMNVPLYKNELKIYASNLNGGNDESPYTDTIVKSNYFAGLNGDYTFESSYSANATFQNFSELKAQLEQGGVYGPSSLKLVKGMYAQSLYIDSIPNRGALSPLIIESQNGDNTTTGFDGYSSTMLQIFRANNLTIRNLSFKQNNNGSNAIILGWNSYKITIENNYFKLSSTTGSGGISGHNVVIGGNWGGQTGYKDSAYLIQNNTIEGGYVGLNIFGDSYKMRDIQIRNNILKNQGHAGLQINSIGELLIDSNQISTNTTDTAFTGISLESTFRNVTITKNRIFIENDGNGVVNSEVYASGNTATDTLLIANNFITTGKIKASIGLNLTTKKKPYSFVYHNSILNRSASANAVGISLNIGAKMQVMNNIIYNRNAGRVLVLNKQNTNTHIQHHNVVYTPGSIFATVNGTHYNSLTALSNAGIDYSSFSGDPLFYADDDLHTEGGIGNDKGTYETYDLVKKDIDNEDRNTTTPDIGADEFTLPDFGVVKLQSPKSDCSHTSSEKVSVWVKNFGTSARINIPVGYRINNGSVVKDTVRVMINPGDSTLFTFTQTANLTAATNYYFDVFTNFRGDANMSNDTLKKSLVATTPAISQLPYYTGFEGSDAGWYTGGTNSSFKWGVIYSGIIDSAANGLNAWKTNLTGPYNNDELSYLYSPCFDLSGLSSPPTLNFNLAYQFENGIDKAWLEYSNDGGVNWKKLGSFGDGLGWYNNYNNYWTGNNKYWHNAKLVLPTASMGNLSSVKFRFVVQTNSSNVQDGLSIDDISIYTGENPPVSSGTYTNRTAVSTGSGNFIPVNDPSGNRILEINDNGQNLGNISVDVRQNIDGNPTSYNGNSYLGRNFVIRVQNAPTAPVVVRLFITQQEFNAWQSQDPTIDQVRSIAVYKYSGSNEDFDLSNNNQGNALIIQPFQITKIPYLDGYLLEFTVNSFSEFWITNGSGGSVPVQFVDVMAQLQNNKTTVTWKVENEQNVREYEVLHSTNGNDWNVVGSVAFHTGNIYNFVHASPIDGKNYYRIKQIDHDGHFMLSKIVSVTKSASFQIQVYPSPFKNVLKIQYNASKAATIQLFSADGRMVMATNLQPGMNVLNTTALTKGVYIYKVFTNGELIQVDKVVKE